MTTKRPGKFSLASRAPLATKQFASYRRELLKRLDGTIKPVPVPWTSLSDCLHGGLWPKTCTVVNGATGAGKTSFAVAIASHAAKHGVPAVYLSLELDGEEMAARLFAIEAGVPWSSLLYGGSRDSLDAATEMALVARKKEWPLLVMTQDHRRLKYEEVGHYVAALRKKYASRLADSDGELNQPCLLVVDYIQLLDTDEDRMDVRARVGAAATYLRAVARDQHAAVLVVSSVSRAHYDRLTGHGGGGFKLGRGDPAMLLASAKESGDLEYSADNVLVLAVDRSGVASVDGHTAWVGVAKARWGTPQPWAELRFKDGAFREAPTMRDLK